MWWIRMDSHTVNQSKRHCRLWQPGESGKLCRLCRLSKYKTPGYDNRWSDPKKFNILRRPETWLYCLKRAVFNGPDMCVSIPLNIWRQNRHLDRISSLVFARTTVDVHHENVRKTDPDIPVVRFLKINEISYKVSVL